MCEELLVYALLLDVEITSNIEYGKYLDALFMETPDNDLLLELEWNFSDIQKSISIIRYYFYDCSIDYDTFGRFLFLKLEEIYNENRMDIQTFGEKTYAIWSRLPDIIHQDEPFWILCYASDPLSWGDEKQTRELYEKAFHYHNSKK